MVFTYPLPYLDGLELLDRFCRTFCSITQYTSASLARDTVTKPSKRKLSIHCLAENDQKNLFKAQIGGTDYFDCVCVVQYTELHTHLLTVRSLVAECCNPRQSQPIQKL